MITDFDHFLAEVIRQPTHTVMASPKTPGIVFSKMDMDRLLPALRRTSDVAKEIDLPGQPPIRAVLHVGFHLMHMLLLIRRADDSAVHDICMMNCPPVMEPRQPSGAICEMLGRVLEGMEPLPDPEAWEVPDLDARSSVPSLRRMQIGDTIHDLKPRSWNPDDDALWASPVQVARLPDRDIVRKDSELRGHLKRMGSGGRDYLGLFEFRIGSWSNGLFLFADNKEGALHYIGWATARDGTQRYLGGLWTTQFVDLVLAGYPWRLLVQMRPNEAPDLVPRKTARHP